MSAFKELLESELLNDDTKVALKEAVESFKEEAITEARSSLEVEYAKKMLAEKQEIAAKMTDLINEAVTQEIAELVEDINHYKDIEPTYAKKLEEFKVTYAKTLSESFEGLIEAHVKDEISELHEDLMEAKQNNFGIKIYESFKSTFDKLGVSDDIQAIKSELESAKSALSESTGEVESLKHEKVLEGLLSSLTGGKKEVMKTILESVSTDKLDERYKETIGSVLEESVTPDNKPEVVIKESVDDAGHVEDMARLKSLIG